MSMYDCSGSKTIWHAGRETNLLRQSSQADGVFSVLLLSAGPEGGDDFAA